MFYAWFVEQCYLSGVELKTTEGPTGEILRELFNELSAAEFEMFIQTWHEFKRGE